MSSVGRLDRGWSQFLSPHFFMRTDEHGAPMVSFELVGHEFIALNGGLEYTFDEAISFQVNYESQQEIDRFWTQLGAGGQEGPCGWLKDKFGVSPGRSCPRPWTKCSAIPTARRPSER